MNKRFIILTAVPTIIALWLLSGCFSSEDESTTITKEHPLVHVRAQHMKASSIQREVVVSGKTIPARTVTLRAETAGRVIALGVPRGGFVDTGDLIAELDERDRLERLRQAEALLEQRVREYEGAQDLLKKGFQSQAKLAESRALLESARAQLTDASLDVRNSKIVAPFPGLLDSRNVEVGDYISIGDAIAVVIERDPLFVRADVTEADILRLKPQMKGFAHLHSGEILEGVLHFISPSANSESRTFAIELSVPNPNSHIPAGITAEVVIPTETLLAYRISPALLSLDNEGKLGVKVVKQGDIVAFYPVDLAKTTPESLWITGLPEEITLITVGQGFVQEGQRVKVSLDPAED